MSEPGLYDSIGRGYASTRRTEPRIAARIWAALGDAETVLNVGAGTGSYEPSDREVAAVEPSATMRAQRPPGAAPCIGASAPVPIPWDCVDGFFHAHWRRPATYLDERVRRGTSVWGPTGPRRRGPRDRRATS